MTAAAVAIAAVDRIFAPAGSETLSLPPDLPSRPGWEAWQAGHDVRLWHHATDVERPFAIFARQDEGSIGFHFGTHSAAMERHRIMFPMIDQSEGYIVGSQGNPVDERKCNFSCCLFVPSTISPIR